MKPCEEKIRYRTAAGARWSLWGIWLDRYLRGGGTAASGARTRARTAVAGTSRRSPSGGDNPTRRHD